MEERIYLKKARLKGYKSIIDTEATFSPGINIIIGDNGSGKTNFLEALYESINNYVFPPTVKGSSMLEIIKVGGDNEGIYSWKVIIDRDVFETLDNKSKIPNFLERYKISANFSYNDKVFRMSGHFSNITDFATDIHLKLYEIFYGKPGFFNIGGSVLTRYGLPSMLEAFAIPTSVKFHTRGGTQIPFGLNTDLGLNILLLMSSFGALEERATVIRDNFDKGYIKYAKKPLIYYAKINDLRLSDALSIRKEGKDFIIDNVQIEFFYADRWHQWNELSDGTKRLILIITNVVMKPDGIVLIEEPELGLYPHQLENLLDFFKEYEDRYQFIITTHSPQVLDILTIKELNRINVAEMTKNGTKIKKLSPKQKKEAKTFYENEGLMSDYWRFDNLGLRK